MCQIIAYGFTQNGSPSSGACIGTTLDTIGAYIDASIEASDVGNPMIGSIDITINSTPSGPYISSTFTPTSAGLHRFNITGINTQVGTYNIDADGCVFISAPDYSNQYCYRCDTSGCKSLIITLPKWQCTNPTTHECTITSSGTFNTKGECEAASPCLSPTYHLACVDGICKKVSGAEADTCTGEGTSCNKSDNTLMYAGLAAAGIVAIYLITKKK